MKPLVGVRRVRTTLHPARRHGCRRIDPRGPSDERDRLDGDEHAGDVGPEADHRPRRLRPGEASEGVGERMSTI